MKYLKQKKIFSVLFWYWTFFLLVNHEMPGKEEELQTVDFYDLPKVVQERSYELRLKEFELQKKKIDFDTRNLRYLPSVDYVNAPFFEKLNLDGFDRKGFVSTLELNWNFQEQGNVALNNLILELEYNRLLLEYRSLFQKELFDQAFQYAETIKLLSFYDYDYTNEKDAEKDLETVQRLFKQGAESYLVTQNSKVDYFFYKYNAVKSRLDQQKSQSQFRRKFLLKKVNLKPIEPKVYETIPLEETLSVYESQLNQSNFDIILSINQVKILEITRQVRFNELWVPDFFVNVYNSSTRSSIYNSAGAWTQPNYLYDFSRNDYSLYSNNPDPIFAAGANFGIRFPIFNRWLSKNEWDKAKVEVSQARAQSQIIQNDVYLFLFELLQQHNNLVELYNISLEAKKTAEENYSIMERAHKTGSASVVELQIVDRRLREVSRNEIQNRYDLIQLRLQIGLLLGDTMKFLK